MNCCEADLDTSGKGMETDTSREGTVSSGLTQEETANMNTADNGNNILEKLFNCNVGYF